METTQATSLADYLGLVTSRGKHDLMIFRGQHSNEPLLPRIARPDSSRNTEAIERNMLSELRRRGAMYITRETLSDWDLLVYAQHYGMATRLLDWTSNPLAALWFACADKKVPGCAYVYLFLTDDEYLLDPSKNPCPFTIKTTKLIKPTLNNVRIIAQHGWFTAHMFNENDNKFVPLNKHKVHGQTLIEIEISEAAIPKILIDLETLGINQYSIFPDFEGLCKYINWSYDIHA